MDPLQQAALLYDELDSLRPFSKDDEQRIMQKFRLDWNYHSNHLEGNQLTYGETKALLLFNITAQGKPLKDHLEMTGHNEAINWIIEVLKEERPCDISEILSKFGSIGLSLFLRIGLQLLNVLAATTIIA